jgi:HK97 family phage portal protein
VGALERLGLRAAADAGAREVVPTRRAARVPVVRSGTSLEVAELAWIAEGITRETALSIPAVDACRNLVVGTVVQLGLYRYRGAERLDPGYLLSKPDPSTTLPATIAGTVDDLLFRGRAYWHVLERDSEGFATRARWTPVDDVTPQARSTGGAYSELTGYRIAGVRDVVPVANVIRFDSGIPGVLDVGGRTLASALELEAAARRLAAVELPAGVLKNEGSELGEEEARELVAGFQASRRENGIAFLQGVAYTREAISPADLQLVEARANVATDVARLFNVPVAMIGASPSGNASALLYSNLSQQLAILVATAVAPHLRTIESTLSDVIPRGQSVAFDVQTFLRSDPQAAADYAIALLGAGIVDATEARSMLGIPSTPPPASDLTPGRV